MLRTNHGPYVLLDFTRSRAKRDRICMKTGVAILKIYLTYYCINISLLVQYFCRISNIQITVTFGNQTHIPVTFVTGNYLSNDRLKW